MGRDKSCCQNVLSETIIVIFQLVRASLTSVRLMNSFVANTATAVFSTGMVIVKCRASPKTFNGFARFGHDFDSLHQT